jgi:hypothetical protein
MDLRHHPGMHVEVNLEGMTVGGIECGAGWMPGVVVGMSAIGTYLTVELDTAIGGGERHGLFHRSSKPQKMVGVELDKARPRDPAEVMPAGIPDEIAELVRAGKTTQALRRYRELNGATLDEARAAIRRL